MQMSSGKLFPSFNKQRVESKIISFNKRILNYFNRKCTSSCEDSIKFS